MTTVTALTVFVPCKLVNPLNGTHGHWTTTAKRRQVMRDATSAAVYRTLAMNSLRVEAPPEQPKRVTFTLHVARLFDDDAVPAIVKSCRDELIALKLISGDGPRDPHVFTYAQLVAKPTGVEIRVELA